MKIHTGCSGFYNKHWKGIFYPDDLPASKWFNFYAEHLDTVELNVTFYRFPTVKLLEGWYNKSPDKFLFAVKAPKLITHEKKFENCQAELHDFYNNCSLGLKEKLACLLFQFPPSFRYSEHTLELILKNMNPDFTNVVEFRHVEWWQPDVYDAFKKNNIIFCNVNHPKLPDTHIETTPITYIRLHGNPEIFYSNYSEEYLLDLHTYLNKNIHLKEAFVFFNNTASTAGIINAQQFQTL